MKARALLTIITFILCVQAVAAFEQVTMEVDIYPDGTSDIGSSILVDSQESDTIHIPAIYPDVVQVHDDESSLRFAVLNDGILVGVGRQDEHYPLNVRYQSTALTSKQGNQWSWTLDTGGLEGLVALVVTVPEGASLNSYSDGGVVYTEDGDLSVGWRFNGEQPPSVEIDYGLDIMPRTMSTSERIKNWIIVGSALILIGILAHSLVDRYLRKVSSTQKDILAALDKNERTIMRFLIDFGKETTQTTIAKRTGLSKASVSRAVKRLVEKNMVESASLGTAKLIKPSKSFQKK